MDPWYRKFWRVLRVDSKQRARAERGEAERSILSFLSMLLLWLHWTKKAGQIAMMTRLEPLGSYSVGWAMAIIVPNLTALVIAVADASLHIFAARASPRRLPWSRSTRSYFNVRILPRL